MNSNLQIALAKDHQHALHSQAARARLAAEARSQRSTTPKLSVRAVWLRAVRLATPVIGAGAITPPSLAGDPAPTAHRLRW